MEGQRCFPGALARRREAPFHDRAASLAIDRDDGAASGAVDAVADEDRGFGRLARHVGGRARGYAYISEVLVAQRGKQRLEIIAAAIEPAQQRALELQRLGPGLVERAVRQPVDAVGETGAQVAGPVRQEMGLRAVGQNQVERVELLQRRGDRVRIAPLAGEQVGHQRAARSAVRGGEAVAAQVGNEREAAGMRHSEPGPARLEVAAREDTALPFGERRGGAFVELVAVADRDEQPPGVRLPGEGGHAHG